MLTAAVARAVDHPCIKHVSAEMSLRYAHLFDSTVRAEYERAATSPRPRLPSSRRAILSPPPSLSPAPDGHQGTRHANPTTQLRVLPDRRALASLPTCDLTTAVEYCRIAFDQEEGP